MHHTPRIAIVLLAALLGACVDQKSAQKFVEAAAQANAKIDTLPRMLNDPLPFKYPPDLYAKKVQGNVVLRVYIDSLGALRQDSTRVETSSGYAAFDSAAIRGTDQLRFSPAKQGGRPIGVTILLPVYFRHPQGAPLTGDSAKK